MFNKKDDSSKVLGAFCEREMSSGNISDSVQYDKLSFKTGSDVGTAAVIANSALTTAFNSKEKGDIQIFNAIGIFED